MASRFSQVTGVEIVDNLTVNIVTKTGSGPLISNVAAVFEAIDSKRHKAVGAEAYDKLPMGIGPFTAKEVVPGVKIVFEKNPSGYWGDPPKVDIVEFRRLAEEGTRRAALQSGDVDVISNISPENVATVEGGSKTLVAPQGRVMTLILRCKAPMGKPLCDTRVRQAIALSLDLEAISKSLYDGMFRVAQGQPATDTMFGFNPKVKARPHDVARARTLLAEAGYKDGFTINMEYPTARWTKVDALVQVMAADMKKIGVTMNLHPVDSGAWLAKYVAGTLEEATMSTLGTAYDLDFNTNRFVCKNAAVFFCDAEFDRVFSEQQQLVDPAARLEKLHELAQIFYDKVAAVPILEWASIWGYSSKVKNVQIYPDVSVNLVSIEPS
jgi:peptide/nickel transport system substrate-binding protein